jgi:hypothetical protein
MEWNWRSRAHDPRFAGFLVLMLGVAGSVLILHRSEFAATAVAVVFAAVVSSIIILLALPPWRDLRHPPTAGGLILGGFGVVVLMAGAVIGFGTGI